MGLVITGGGPAFDGGPPNAAFVERETYSCVHCQAVVDRIRDDGHNRTRQNVWWCPECQKYLCAACFAETQAEGCKGPYLARSMREANGLPVH